MARTFGRSESWAVVVAYDPGGTTGWAVVAADAASLEVGGPSLRASIRHAVNGEIKGTLNSQCQQILDLIDAWPKAAVVGEDFTIRKFSMDDAFVSPIKINAVVDFGITQGRKLYFQQPSMAKSTMTDERLKDYNLYHHNSPHARDASRHAVTFLRRAAADVALRKEAFAHLYG